MPSRCRYVRAALQGIPDQYVRIGIDVDGVRLLARVLAHVRSRARWLIAITVKAIPTGRSDR